MSTKVKPYTVLEVTTQFGMSWVTVFSSGHVMISAGAVSVSITREQLRVIVSTVRYIGGTVNVRKYANTVKDGPTSERTFAYYTVR